MKLLFDQNISFRLISRIEKTFPGSTQVRLEGLENSTELEIWKYAKKYHFSIVTFDADFYDLSTIKGHPPKIIWLRFGNTSTVKPYDRLLFYKESLQKFLSSSEFEKVACLELK